MFNPAILANHDASSAGSYEGKLPSFQLDEFRDKSYLTHGLHPYPAKFVPQIPRLLIDKLTTPSSVVLDPFCGSGTTLVEGMLAGRQVLGVDSNELAVKIARAKTTILSQDAHADLLHWLKIFTQHESVFRSRASLTQIEPDIPEFKNRDHWFTQQACVELGIIRSLINSIASECSKNILEVVFSSIIVKCSRQESDTRWCAVDKPFSVGDALALMRVRLKAAIERLADFSVKAASAVPAQVTCGDTRHMSCIDKNSVDAVITSPPYLNSFDYYLYHKLRMFWLNIDHYKIQEAEIGSRNKHCDKNESSESFIEAMSDCAVEFGRVLKPNGIAAIVIGDSIYKGDLISMDTVYEEIMNKQHFRLIDIFSFDQRKYTRAFTPNVKTAFKKSHIMLFSR